MEFQVLKKDKQIIGNAQSARVIAAFGDFKGFSDFFESSAFEEQERREFMRNYDYLVEKMARENEFSFEDTGDGFFFIVDLPSGHNCKTMARLLSSLYRLMRGIKKMIERKNHPRPDGFGVVVFSGIADRTVKRNGRIVYRGACINWAHKCLHAYDGMIVHASARQLLSKAQERRHGFIYKLLPLPSVIPQGLPRKEASVLYSFKIDERKVSR